MTQQGVESNTADSTKVSLPKGPTVSSLTTSALSSNGRDNMSAVPINASPTIRRTATSESRKNTTPATPPTLPQANRSAGSTEQTTPVHETQEERSRSTALSSMATSAKTLKQNQRVPTTPRLASSSILNGLESSLSTDSQMSAKITAPAALNIPGDDITSSRSMTATVSEKSATMKSSTALNKTTDVKESLYPGQRVQLSTLTLTTLRTAASRTTISGTQEGETIGAPPPQHAAQLPETAAAHLIALIPSSSGTTQPSDRTGSSQASPKPTQSSSPGARDCAPDKYPAEGGVADNSYYAYSELSLVLVALHCQPQTIEVVLSSCFLKTYRWILREGTFSGCPSVSKIEEDHRVQVFVLEKKEGTCGLCLSVTLAFNLFHFVTSDTFYLRSRVTLCDKREGRPCQPKSSPGRNRAWEIPMQGRLKTGAGWVVIPLTCSETPPTFMSSHSSLNPEAWIAVFILMVIGLML
ncbi:Hypothetical predicted protein [Lynx pardinus]|uniref:Uncharacterized protein n=1 Tax=Lynx pardinus TaxID=191816 RepID=A0A485NVT4_LYNPA|nr:Hypothetical predicted protein [Lynx pardinus]